DRSPSRCQRNANGLDRREPLRRNEARCGRKDGVIAACHGELPTWFNAARPLSTTRRVVVALNVSRYGAVKGVDLLVGIIAPLHVVNVFLIRQWMADIKEFVTKCHGSTGLAQRARCR